MQREIFGVLSQDFFFLKNIGQHVVRGNSTETPRPRELSECSGVDLRFEFFMLNDAERLFQRH